MDEELKSCPFCGSKDVRLGLFMVNDNVDDITLSYCYCDSCGSRGPAVNFDEEKYDSQFMKEQAIKLWNERS